MSTSITKIKAQQILDSRGNPTVEANVFLSDGTIGTASAPSGASTGDKEAIELRDNNLKRWLGRGVQQAVDNVDNIIAPTLKGIAPYNIQTIDNIMLELDGTQNKSKLGANSILAVSLATLKAAALSKKMSLYSFICNYQYNNFFINEEPAMPVPMMNILNGGSHADNNVDIQEFMIMPINFTNYSEALRAGVEIFHALKQTLKTKGYNTAIGDEGGFAPNLTSNEEAIELILYAIQRAGYTAGHDIFLALDVAASEFYSKDKKKYILESENKELTAAELIDYYQMLCSKYPIISIEDGLDQNDWKGWSVMNAKIGNTIQIVGDDLTVTNPAILEKAINLNSMNAILIKLNQIGTFSETLDTINIAKKNNFNTIISHRSGETEDTTIADLAVATSAGQIKTGSLCRTDRTAKYNQLLRIEKELGKKAKYANKTIMRCQEKKH